MADPVRHFSEGVAFLIRSTGRRDLACGSGPAGVVKQGGFQVINRTSGSYLVFASALVPAMIGCSARQADPPAQVWRAPAKDVELPVATMSVGSVATERGSESPQRLKRQIPYVISRPRPFRVADTVASAPVTDGPATMLVGHTALIGRSPSSSSAVSKPPLALGDGSPGVAEIRTMLREYLRAFNRHDVAALAAHWSDTGESLDLDSGEVTASGREAVRGVFAALFEQDPSTAIDIDVHSVRLLRDDVAVIDGVSLLSFTDGAPAGSRFSAVVVRKDDRWVLENLREAARPVQDAATVRPLDELGWLVGSWEDCGDGLTAGTRCAWTGGRGFLIRSHVVAADNAAELPPASGDDRVPGLLPAADAPAREITEIVGWDPDRDTIRSWIFSSDGRFAEGTWRRSGDTWTIHVEGRGRDEGCEAVCTLSRDGAEGFTMQCVTDRLANLLPPACGFTRTAR